MAKTNTFKLLKASFEKKYNGLLSEFEEKHADSLQWLKEKGIDLEALPDQAKRSAVATAAAGVMLLSSGIAPQKELPGVFQAKELPGSSKDEVKAETDKEATVRQVLEGKLPLSPRALTKEEEKALEEELSKIYGFSVKSELEGKRLNTAYGYIGTESHLTRYPGDNLSTHFDSEEAALHYGRTGMAGGRGAFGYFSSRGQAIPPEEIEMEKYYVVAQTFASPAWGQRGVYEWFKHRKFLVVNPATGKAVVGVLGDSGPALSTGKQFGGSPEVMDALGLYPPKAKQAVLFLFVDEGGSAVALGAK